MLRIHHVSTASSYRWQGAFDEAEEGFRSQIKILEEESSRKDVCITAESFACAALISIITEAHDGHDKEVPEGASFDAEHNTLSRYGHCSESPREAESAGTYQLVRPAAEKRNSLFILASL